MKEPSQIERAFVRFVERPRLAVSLAACAVLLSSPALVLGFFFDDFVGRYVYSNLEGAKHLFDLFAGGYALANGDPADTHWQIEQGWAPWWTFDHLLLRLFRPFGVASHWIDFQLWPSSALLMHLHNLLWLALLVWVATRIYRSALGLTVGGAAAFLFAVDHTHGFVVGYISNRHALISAVLAVLSLDRHLRASATQSYGARSAAYVLYALALASGESTIGILGYLVAHGLCVERAPLAKRLLRVAPYLIITLAWRAFYSRAGYGAFGSGLYIDPGRDPVAYAIALCVRAPVLLLGQFLAPPAELYTIWPAPWARVMLVVAWLFTIAFLAALWPLRKNRMAWCWLLGALFALVPAASTYPHNRQLLFTSFGAMALLAQLWELHSVTLRNVAVAGIERFSRELSGALCFAHIIVSPLVMPITTCGIVATTPLSRGAAAVGDDVAGRDAVFVTAPDYFAVKLVRLQRLVAGRPLPRRFRPLSFGPEHTTVRRTAANALELDFAEGLLSTPFMELYRDRDIPMARGERIELEGLSIEVLEVMPDGRARTVRFRFDDDLEHPRFRFYAWARGRFVPFSLPAPGQSVALPPAQLEFGL